MSPKSVKERGSQAEKGSIKAEYRTVCALGTRQIEGLRAVVSSCF